MSDNDPIEIEAPSRSQIADSQMQEIIEFAASGASEMGVISRLVGTGIPLEKAKEIAPTVLKAARGKRRRRQLPRMLFGWFLLGSGVLFLAGLIWGGAFHPGPILMIIAGVALLSGYISFGGGSGDQ